MTNTKEVAGLSSEEIKLRIEQIKNKKVRKVAVLCWQLVEGEFDGDPWDALEIVVQDMPFYQMIKERGEDKQEAIKKSVGIIGQRKENLRELVGIALEILEQKQRLENIFSQKRWEPSYYDGCGVVL